ncbi:conserved membrane hypothetical protein [Frankia sp. Hr75.2]|nr:conserved membrane hypothetical protein [Frankia sp. Hr75.2]
MTPKQGSGAVQSVRDWWITGGMAVAALSAAISSFAGLRSLASAAGWPEPLAPLLPLTVDAYAITATRVWLTRGTGSAGARRFARWNALLAMGLSLVGNGLWHLAEAGMLTVGWPIVVGTGSVPPIVLGLLSHLAVLRGQNGGPPGTAAVLGDPLSQDASRSESIDGPEAEDPLLAAARAADVEYRASHDGRPITRDALRRELGVSTGRAGEVLREMRQARDEA